MLATTTDNDGAARERRCIATGKIQPEDRLVRFVLSPDGAVVPDLDGKLPGRGLWLSATRADFAKAVAKGDFAKAAKAKVKLPDDLIGHVSRLLTARLAADLGMARRAGLADTGFDSVLRALDKKIPPALLFHAADAADDGRRKLYAAVLSRGLKVRAIDVLTRDELGAALGRDNVVHAAVRPSTLADRLAWNANRLAGLKADPSDTKCSALHGSWNESTL